MCSSHVLDLILQRLHLLPHCVVIPIFLDLLIVNLDLLNDAGGLLQFKSKLLYQVVLRLNLFETALAHLLPSYLDAIGQSSIVFLEHANVILKCSEFLLGKCQLFSCLAFDSSDLLVQLVDLELVLFYLF